MRIIKLLSLVSLLSVLFAGQASAAITVIVNNANSVSLTQNDVSRIFLGKLKRFANGDSVTPVNANNSVGTRTLFNKAALNKSSSQVKAYWSKLVFSGKGTPPKELDSDAKIKAFVASNPNAIGYIDSANLDATVTAALSL